MEEQVHCRANRIGCQGRNDSSVILSLLENVSLYVYKYTISIYYICILLAKINKALETKVSFSLSVPSELK